MNYIDAKETILKKYSDSVINSSYKLKDDYLFSIRPKNFNDTQTLLDPYFKVSNSGKITEYSPVMDPAEFKAAMKNRIE